MTHQSFARHCLKWVDPSAINLGIWCELNASGALGSTLLIQCTIGYFLTNLSNVFQSVYWSSASHDRLTHCDVSIFNSDQRIRKNPSANYAINLQTRQASKALGCKRHVRRSDQRPSVESHTSSDALIAKSASLQAIELVKLP